MDIGTPERYLQASWDILDGVVETRVTPTGPGMLVDESAEVSAEAALGPHAVVGPGCRVGTGAEIRDSVLLEGCVVGAGASVGDSILAPGVEVEAGAEIGVARSSAMGKGSPRADARRRPRDSRSPSRRALAGRFGPARDRGLRGPSGLRHGRLGDRSRPRRRCARRPPGAADADRPRLRAAELGHRRVDRALLELLGRNRGDARLLRGGDRARRPPDRRQHRRHPGRAGARGGGAGDRPAGHPAAARRRRLHVHRRRPGRGARRARPVAREGDRGRRRGASSGGPRICRPEPPRSRPRSRARSRSSTGAGSWRRSPGAGRPRSTRTPSCRPSIPSSPRRTTTRSAAGGRRRARGSRPSCSRTPTRGRACGAASS